ncbi:MAG: hypothetical protein V3T70_12030, partial [Phycisphaerae bacterium]
MKAEIAESAATLDAWDRFVARHPHGTHAQMSWWLAAHQRSVLDTRVVCCLDGDDVQAGLAVFR